MNLNIFKHHNAFNTHPPLRRSSSIKVIVDNKFPWTRFNSITPEHTVPKQVSGRPRIEVLICVKVLQILSMIKILTWNCIDNLSEVFTSLLYSYARAYWSCYDVSCCEEPLWLPPHRYIKIHKKWSMIKIVLTIYPCGFHNEIIRRVWFETENYELLVLLVRKLSYSFFLASVIILIISWQRLPFSWLFRLIFWFAVICIVLVCIYIVITSRKFLRKKPPLLQVIMFFQRNDF